MARPTVKQPIPGPLAFQNDDSDSTLSQSAFLLLLSDQLTRNFRGLVREGDDDGASAILQVPELRPLEKRREYGVTEYQMFQSGSVENFSNSRHLNEFPRESVKKMIDQVYKERNSLAVLALMEACLDHPDPLVRVSSAVAQSRIYAEQGRFISIIEQVVQAKDELPQRMALTALHHLVPNHPQFDKSNEPESKDESPEESTISLLVHGTFGREDDPSWWQPQGDFHDYIKQSVAPDLYSQNDYYKWSGGYSDNARKVAAKDLLDWSSKQPRLNHVFAHSHGGNVAMLATRRGLCMDKLVLMSCPFDRRYSPNYNNVPDVVSIRVRFDLVVMVDRLFSGKRAKPPGNRIRDVRLNVWFDHFKTRDPKIWDKHQIASRL